MQRHTHASERREAIFPEADITHKPSPPNRYLHTAGVKNTEKISLE